MDLICASKGARASLSVAAAVALAIYAPSGLAQQAGEEAVPGAASDNTGALAEVVITAQKRVERLEDVPVAATVVSNSTLEDSNVSDVSDLNKLVPSLNINGTISGRAPMGIRGISSVSNEQAVGVPSGVAIMIDGVPVPSDSYDGNQIEDMQNVEVLEGPQATLGGRTAAAGIINYVTYNPTDHLVGGITGTATTDTEYRGAAHISGPLWDNLEFSLSGYDAQRYYPITNEFYDTKADQKTSGLRAKLLWKISDDIDAKFTYHHGRVKAGGFNFVYTYLTPGADLLFTPGPLTQALLLPGITPSWTNLEYDSPVSTAGHEQADNDGQLDLNFNLGGGYTLTSTSAYQYENQTQIQDLFATAAYFFDTLVGGPPFTPVTSNPHVFNDTQAQNERIEQKSEEIKVVSPADQPVSFVAGLFYSDTAVTMTYHRGLPPAALNVDVSPGTATYDTYGRATWKFLPATALIAGLRYNFDQLRYDYNQVIYNGQGPFTSTGSSSSSALVGDLSLQQQLSTDVMAYATYARGYSPKVYNTAATLTSVNEVLQPVSQEHINNFEIGTKGTYLDHHLTLNVDIFDTIYEDYQIQSYSSVIGQITSDLDLSSAGKAETRGAEFSSSWRATDLTTLSANAAYINAVFKNYVGAPCEGYTNPTTPPPNCTPQYAADSETIVDYIQNMSGQTMPNAPRWKLYVDAQQRVPLGALPLNLLLDANWAYRTKAEMLPDNNPNAIMGPFGILNLSLSVQSSDGKWSVTGFCNNAFNKIYYQDVEDFWNGPWSGTSSVVAQPARDAVRYGGVRFNASL
jgi:iron complex outermembrane receptor protein